MARYRRAGRPSPKTRMVQPLPNTAPFHKASSRRYGAGTQPIETVSLQYRSSSPAAAPFYETPPYRKNAERGAFLLRRRQPRYGLSNASPDGPGNRPRSLYPVSRSCATATRSTCATAIYPARKAGMAARRGTRAARRRFIRCQSGQHLQSTSLHPTPPGRDGTSRHCCISPAICPPRAAVTPLQRILDPRRSVDVSGPTGARCRFAKRGCFRLRGRPQAEVTHPRRRLRADPERGRR